MGKDGLCQLWSWVEHSLDAVWTACSEWLRLQVRSEASMQLVKSMQILYKLKSLRSDILLDSSIEDRMQC